MGKEPMTDFPSPIEQTPEWTLIDLHAVPSARPDQRQYHVFSEEGLRGEIFNLDKGDGLGPFKYAGNVLLIPLRGRLMVVANAQARTISPGSQLLINSGIELSCEALEQSSFEVIWAPPFSTIQQHSKPNEA
jgi:hypothetical protein